MLGIASFILLTNRLSDKNHMDYFVCETRKGIGKTRSQIGLPHTVQNQNSFQDVKWPECQRLAHEFVQLAIDREELLKIIIHVTFVNVYGNTGFRCYRYSCDCFGSIGSWSIVFCEYF
jgi:hypothetical protein